MATHRDSLALLASGPRLDCQRVRCRTRYAVHGRLYVPLCCRNSSPSRHAQLGLPCTGGERAVVARGSCLHLQARSPAVLNGWLSARACDNYKVKCNVRACMRSSSEAAGSLGPSRSFQLQEERPTHGLIDATQPIIRCHVIRQNQDRTAGPARGPAFVRWQGAGRPRPQQSIPESGWNSGIS